MPTDCVRIAHRSKQVHSRLDISTGPARKGMAGCALPTISRPSKGKSASVKRVRPSCDRLRKPEHAKEGGLSRRQPFRFGSAQLAHDQPLVQRYQFTEPDHRFDLQSVRCARLYRKRVRICFGSGFRGDESQYHVRAPLIVAGHHESRPQLGRRKIGEGKRDKDDATEIRPCNS